MQRSRIDPEKITRPLQLAGAWFATLLGVEGGLLATATQIDQPTWGAGVLVVAAVAMPVGAALGVFLLQTRYRLELLADREFSDIFKAREKLFRDFDPIRPAPSVAAVAATSSPAERATRRQRTAVYEQHRGLFLVHTWRPSAISGQIADVVIHIHQHGEGPLTHGMVERVEYDLGSMFSAEPIVKTNRKENLRLDVSAWGPFLCVATVYFSDGASPIELDRYIDFS